MIQQNRKEQTNYIHALHPAQQQRTMQQVDRACSLYYLMMGSIYNTVQSAMVDAREAVMETPLYRHRVKLGIRKALRAYDVLGMKIRNQLADKYQLWLDTTDAFDDELRPHVQKLFLAVDGAFLAHNVPYHRAVARMETARVLADIAHLTFKQLFRYLRKTVGINLECLFTGGDFGDVAHAWGEATRPLFASPDTPDVNLNSEKNVNLAVEVIGNMFRNPQLLNRAGNYALHRNPDQWKLLDEEDRKCLEAGLDIV